jgi:hypothetical protein
MFRPGSEVGEGQLYSDGAPVLDTNREKLHTFLNIPFFTLFYSLDTVK